MKTFLIVLFAGILIGYAHAQKTIDVVQLKTGSIIKGKLLESSAESIKIETECHNVWAFSVNEVSRIDTEPWTDPRSIKSKGYFNLSSAGVLVGSTANELRAPFSALIENNYRFNEYISAGLVTGLEMLNEATVPAAVSVKGMLALEGGSILFLGGMLGYSISVEDPTDPVYEIKESYGGNLAGAEIGLIFPSYGHLSFFLAAGYRYNELSYTRSDWWREEVDRTIYYKRISLRVGIAFY